jgi:hypothetical protein
MNSFAIFAALVLLSLEISAHSLDSYTAQPHSHLPASEGYNSPSLPSHAVAPTHNLTPLKGYNNQVSNGSNVRNLAIFPLISCAQVTNLISSIFLGHLRAISSRFSAVMLLLLIPTRLFMEDPLLALTPNQERQLGRFTPFQVFQKKEWAPTLSIRNTAQHSTRAENPSKLDRCLAVRIISQFLVVNPPQSPPDT